MEWSKQKYNNAYNSYVPWLEDKYLAWFGENKTSYTAKEQLKGTKITGDKNINAIQDGVAEGVGGQFSSGGLLGGVGDMSSKEGVNRAERGDYGPLDQKKLQEQQQGGPAGAVNTVTDGVKGGLGSVGGLLGGGKK